MINFIFMYMLMSKDLSPIRVGYGLGEDLRDTTESYLFLENMQKKITLDLLQSPNIDIHNKIKIIKENNVIKKNKLFDQLLDDFYFEFE